MNLQKNIFIQHLLILNYVWNNTDMRLECGKDTTERWHMQCHRHYFSLWEITLPRDNVSYATVTAKHKTSMAGNSSIFVSLIALSSDRRQIPWNAVLQFLEINGLQTESIKIFGNMHSARAPSLPTARSPPPLQYHDYLFMRPEWAQAVYCFGFEKINRINNNRRQYFTLNGKVRGQLKRNENKLKIIGMQWH